MHDISLFFRKTKLPLPRFTCNIVNMDYHLFIWLPQPLSRVIHLTTLYQRLQWHFAWWIHGTSQYCRALLSIHVLITTTSLYWLDTLNYSKVPLISSNECMTMCIFACSYYRLYSSFPDIRLMKAPCRILIISLSQSNTGSRTPKLQLQANRKHTQWVNS